MLSQISVSNMTLAGVIRDVTAHGDKQSKYCYKIEF